MMVTFSRIQIFEKQSQNGALMVTKGDLKSGRETGREVKTIRCEKGVKKIRKNKEEEKEEISGRKN